MTVTTRAHTPYAADRRPPGIVQIAFAPGGRYAFVINKRRHATIIDRMDRVVHTVDLAGARQVRFTSTMAFVRQTTTATVMMLPLDQLAAEPGKLPVLGFPGGSNSPASEEWPSSAASIESVAGDRAVLVANAGDREIYYYQEGLAVPMGSFSNYKRQPRAVTVVRRDLRESAPGVYQTNASLGVRGATDLVFRPTSRVLPLLPVRGRTASAQARQPPRVAPASLFDAVPAGRPVSLSFIVTDAATGAPVDDLTDLTALVATPAWQIRLVAQPLGEGRYGVTLAVPLPGATRWSSAARMPASIISRRPGSTSWHRSDDPIALIGARLSTLEQLSIQSFLDHGHAFHLYVYQDLDDPPPGTVLKDANEILPASEIFQYPDRKSVAAFANIFRYKLLLERGGWWADTDMVCLRPLELSDAHVFVSETIALRGAAGPQTVVGNCLIKAPAGSPAMQLALRTSLARDRATLRWGEIGPRLVGEVDALDCCASSCRRRHSARSATVRGAS